MSSIVKITFDYLSGNLLIMNMTLVELSSINRIVFRRKLYVGTEIRFK